MAEKEAEASSTIQSIVLVTIPATLIYFVGWAYLHYYLGAFAIDLAELEFGVETVLIYAAPPIFSMCSRHKVILAAGMFVLVGVSVWAYRRGERHLQSGSTSPAVHGSIVPAASRPSSWLGALMFFLKGLWALVVLVFLGLILTPEIRDIAVAKAQAAWVDDSIPIQVIVAEPEKLSQQYENYGICQEARRLHLLFSDKDRYFMLCTSEIDPDRAAVYEVRRDDSELSSVRYVRRPGK